MADEEEQTTSSEEEEEGTVETSLEELLQRKDRRPAGEDEDEDALIEAMDEREGRTESLTVTVVPPQPTEFTCRKCFLLKHRSQLKDKKKMLCMDCG